MDVLERLGRETGRDYALRVLKENIINLKLEPGSMVSENELASQMGLSRTPVREALMELSKVKIVDVYPQRGSSIALIDYDLVEESRFIRKTLECAVTELVCQRATEADLEALRSNVQLQHFYLENNSPRVLMDLDNGFHKKLFEIANKLQAHALMDNISIHFDRVRNMALVAVKDLKIVQDHESLVDAFSRRDEKAAAEIMEKHLSRYKIDAENIQLQYPQYIKQV